MKNKAERRRGDDLLESLFDATTGLLNTVKHTNLTFQQIADAAGTSRTVLYRRWPTMFDLLQDIYIYKTKRIFKGDFFSNLSNTGTLRGDLMQLMTVYQNVYAEIGAEVLNNYYYIRMQNKDVKEEPSIHVGALKKHLDAVRGILKNANARGEKTKKVSTITLMLPYDLLRVENLIRMNTINKKRIAIMVDEILLPAFKK